MSKINWTQDTNIKKAQNFFEKSFDMKTSGLEDLKR